MPRPLALVAAFAFAFVLALTSRTARADALVLEGDVREITVGPHVELAYDPSGRLDATSVVGGALPWAANAKEVPTFGYRDGAEWARVRIDDRRGPGASRGAGLRRVGAVRVKGRSEPIDLFEVLACCATAEERAAKEATAETFQLALAAFVRGEMDEARDRFQEVVGQSPEGVVAMRYAKRAASYADRGLPSNFEGDFGAL